MTAVPAARIHPARGRQGHYGIGSVGRMEWVKLRSVRSTGWRSRPPSG